MINEQLFDTWYTALEQRHLKTFTFPEVRRALQALSSLYVERRSQAGVRRVLDGAGKRAAFALFYAPLHLLEVSYVVEKLQLRELQLRSIVDLGCGTGTAGAGWGLELQAARITGIDTDPWVLEEARWNYQALGVAGEIRKANLLDFHLKSTGGTLLAFTVNELDETGRQTLLRRLLRIGTVLIIEPIAHRVTPWWDQWTEAFQAKGGRADQWSFRPVMPERLRLLDKAAGLDHRELKCRTLWLPPA